MDFSAFRHQAGFNWIALGSLLGLTLLLGLAYVLIVPPWQHYDEPTHFEFTWAFLLTPNQEGARGSTYTLRRDIAASMVEHRFFATLPFTPELLDPPNNIWIGIPQIQDPPLYYFVAGLPLRLIPFADVVTQLYLVRGISLIFLMGTIGISFGIMTDLTPKGHALQYLVPLVLCLTPAFIELMTSVNNDVGAVFCFSAYLWIGLRILQRGVNRVRLLAFSLSLAACFFVKNTVWISIPLAALLPFLLLSIKPRLRKVALLVPAGFLLVGGISSLSAGDAAQWYRANQPDFVQPGTRTRVTETDLGTQALTIDSAPPGSRSQILYQPYPQELVTRLQGQAITLGVWIWASEPALIEAPIIWYDGKTTSEKIQINTTPQFWAGQVQLPQDLEQLQVVLDPKVNHITGPVHIFYDGLKLQEGSWSAAELTVFGGGDSDQVLTPDRQLSNLARNGSFEDNWLTIDPNLDRFMRRNSPINLSNILATLQDLENYRPIYLFSLMILFQSFWARFGWNQIALAAPWYWMLGVISLAGIGAGVFFGIDRLRKGVYFRTRLSLFWLGLAAVLMWLSALMRINFPVWGNQTFIPSARYTYPAILPVMLLFSSGWYWLFKKVNRLTLGFSVIILFLTALHISSLVKIFQF